MRHQDDEMPPGSTVPCGDIISHGRHAWVQKNASSPMVCLGYPWPEGDFPCCANAQDGYGHHAGCLKGSPPGARMIYPLYATQAQHDDLAEELARTLDEAQHLEACWISEDETRCVCIIEKLRALIPRCGHVEQVGTKGLTRQCLSTVHPSQPYKHVFGTV